MRRALFVAAALLALPAAAAAAGDDAAAIIAKAFETARVNEAKALEYVFHERIEEVRFDRQGGEKKREARTWDVTLYEGGDYRRLIAINDRPLFPETEAKEQRKLEKHIRKLERETPRERRRRMAKIEEGRQEGEEFLEEITKAFDFRLLREEEVGALPTWVISAEPREGYQPPDRISRVLRGVRATLWVSQTDYAWVQAEIDTFEDFSWMGIYKLKSGAEIRFKQRQVDDEVWLTDHWSVKMRARIAFVYRLEAEIKGSYSNFRRFSTETIETGFERAEDGAPN